MSGESGLVRIVRRAATWDSCLGLLTSVFILVSVFAVPRFATAFNITMLEGTEVVFIVIAIAAGGTGLMLPAGMGAVAALVVVTILGLILHRPLARVPENTLKFVVGILLSAFGTFWVGEGMAVGWPHEDWSLLGLALGYWFIAAAAVPVCRRIAHRAAAVRDMI